MSYIVQRQDRFYVVAYDGLDPLTGRERRRWHPVGHDRAEAEQLAERLDRERDAAPVLQAGPITFGEFLTNTWVPHKRRHLRATTAYRYAWFVERYIRPTLGEVPLRRLRADHLDHLYDTLESAGGRSGQGLAPKTVHEVHAVVRASLDHAVERRLVDRNVAHRTKDRRRPPASGAARSWTASELNAFLTAARERRLFPALHLAAHTGMRRGEIVGLKWSDLSIAHARLSVSRTVQRDCQEVGVTGLAGHWLLVMLRPQKRRPSKVMAKALRAGFQRFIQRSWPVPLGSSERTTRYRHLSAACSLGKCPRARVARRNLAFSDSIAFVSGMTSLTPSARWSARS